MPVLIRVRRISPWRKEFDDKVGMLACTLKPLTKAGARLRLLLGYRNPTDGKGAIELYPVRRKRVSVAASEVGLSPFAVPTLLVEAEDRPGIGFAIAKAIADANINMTFFVGQTIGGRFGAVVGFETEDDAKKAEPLIKRVPQSLNAGIVWRAAIAPDSETDPSTAKP